MTDRLHQQVVALAAALQALALIIDVARHGKTDPALTAVCLQGLLRPYQPDIARLYGGARQLKAGLTTLREQLTQPRDMELTRYLIAILHLEARLRKQPTRLQAISAGLEHARRQAEYFDGLTTGTVHASLARLYTEHVSNLRPRVIVAGERAHLEQPQNVDLIRALLLAAVRAVTLWREAGGSRLDLIFRRRKLLQMADELRA